jgi:hypothetical protein
MEYFVVMKPQNLQILCFQILLPLRIIFGAIFVAQSIQLNNEALRRAKEIHYKLINRLLSPEFQTGKLACAQAIPENCFGWCAFSAKPSRALSDYFWHGGEYSSPLAGEAGRGVFNTEESLRNSSPPLTPPARGGEFFSCDCG